MNILYISKLDGRPWIGPTYSVFKQVKAQSKYDSVFWYNLCDEGLSAGQENLNEWRKLDYYSDLYDYPNGKIANLPEPFSYPDLVIVEQVYPFARNAIRKELTNGDVPYVIVPRGELTNIAQSKKKLKKMIGNIIFLYHKFIKNAAAIHCLTKQESENTSEKWNKKKLVLSNGIDILDNIEKKFSSDCIRCVFIGRIEPFQKGLDLLIEACVNIKEKLIEYNCVISIYGSNQENKLEIVKKTVLDNGLKQIINFYEPVYKEQKEKVLMNSDVFLMPSRFEGHPTGLLEALAYGLPSIVTTGSNMREEIDKANAGWTAENTVESVKKAILKMLEEKNMFSLKSKNARKLAQQYDWDAIAKRSHEEYIKLIKK